MGNSSLIGSILVLTFVEVLTHCISWKASPYSFIGARYYSVLMLRAKYDMCSTPLLSLSGIPLQPMSHQWRSPPLPQGMMGIIIPG